jgi:glycosidase
MHWWAGMHHSELQVLLHGEHLAGLRARVDHPGVQVARTVSVENSNYLFIYLRLDPTARPGRFDIKLHDAAGDRLTVPYELRRRDPHSAERVGFRPSDVIYMITPDRFANGDPTNDEITGMREGLNRAKPFGRHGGDLQGIIDHLDYLEDLGITFLWLNPPHENDQSQWSYHGYAITDFYRIDPRYGSNADYSRLVAEAGRRGIGVLMDFVPNHCGSEHWFFKDPPTTDWFNFQDEFTRTNHIRTVHEDIHASAHDRRLMTDGWFVETMPDPNQRNPLVAVYLIQNTIWWIEEAGLRGIRVDTHPYPDKHFMARWARAVLAEYPHLSHIGEEWSLSPAIVSYWQRGQHNHDDYDGGMTGMVDFPLNHAVATALNDPLDTWGQGFIKLYEILAHDFLYPDSDALVIFPDNHDMDRFFTQVKEDYGLYRIGLVFNLTTRGIPQLYYGSEILMHNRGHPNNHGVIRSDFPGGWDEDRVNAFTGEGLTAQQADALAFNQRLLNWRKDATAIHHGRLLHFAPDNDTYTYFRYTDDATVMVVLNKRHEAAKLPTARFAEILPAAATGRDVLTGETQDLSEHVTVPARGALLLEILNPNP